LEKDDVYVSATTIYRRLKQRRLIREHKPSKPRKRWVRPEATAAHQHWLVDLTYILTGKGLWYLIAIIDLYSRYVVGWELSAGSTAQYVQRVIDFTLAEWGFHEKQTKPVIHSDNGPHMKAKPTKKFLKDLGVLNEYPRLHIPQDLEDDKGLQLAGLIITEDVPYQHSLLLELLVGVNSRRPSLLFSYTNHQSYPIIQNELFDQSLCEKAHFQDSLPDSLNKYWSRGQGGCLRTGPPLNLRSNVCTTSLFLQLGLTGKKVFWLSEIPASCEQQASRTGNYVGIGGGVTFLNSYASFKDILPIYTPLLEITWETTGSRLGSDYKASELRANICHVLPLGNPIQTLSHLMLLLNLSLELQQGNYGYENCGPLPRGYDKSTGPFNLKNLALASVQYEFPLWYIDNGWGNFPLLLRRAAGDLFLDCGTGWKNQLGQQSGKGIFKRARTSWGAELKLHTFLFYQLPLCFGLRAAYQPGKRQVTLYPTLSLFNHFSDKKPWRKFQRRMPGTLFNQKPLLLRSDWQRFNRFLIHWLDD